MSFLLKAWRVLCKGRPEVFTTFLLNCGFVNINLETLNPLRARQITTLTLIIYIAYHRFSIQVSFLRGKLAYVHPCGSIRGPGDGRRLFVGRLLTKAVVLPQTMQSPSHYSAVFRREAANIHEHSLALPDYWEEEEKETLCILPSRFTEST